MLQSDPIRAPLRMTQNCQTLVPEPTNAPSATSARRWISEAPAAAPNLAPSVTAGRSSISLFNLSCRQDLLRSGRAQFEEYRCNCCGSSLRGIRDPADPSSYSLDHERNHQRELGASRVARSQVSCATHPQHHVGACTAGSVAEATSMNAHGPAEQSAASARPSSVAQFHILVVQLEPLVQSVLLVPRACGQQERPSSWSTSIH